MNPNVSANWLITIIFMASYFVLAGTIILRRSSVTATLTEKFGNLCIVTAFAGILTATLYYQGALKVKVWPTFGIHDQVLVSTAGDIFVKVKNPILPLGDRIQRYNCRGEFKTAFIPDNAGGSYKIALNQDNTLSIYSVRTNSIDTFAVDGTFLQRRILDDRQMPFNFLKKGPSITEANSCSLTRDPASGRLAAKDSTGIWPLERGDWVLEYILNRQNIWGIALIGALIWVFSVLKKNR